MNNVAQLVAVADVSQFADLTSVAIDSDFVQVTVGDRTFARPVPARHSQSEHAALAWADLAAEQVQVCAALVSTPALVSWLIDSGFSLVN